ncbi:MAG: hypothetical protein ACP5J4_04310 [Anaerolineae bacterium]
MLKKSLAIVVLVASVLLALPLVAGAQEGEPPAEAPFFQGGRGQRGGHGWMGGEISLVEAAAEATGLAVEDVVAALQGGQSFADIASGAGVSLQAIVDVAVAQRTAALEEAVAEGRFTQEQADTMLASMAEHLLEQLNAEWTAGGMGGRSSGQGMSRGRGGMRGGNRMNYNPETCPQL